MIQALVATVVILHFPTYGCKKVFIVLACLHEFVTLHISPYLRGLCHFGLYVWFVLTLYSVFLRKSEVSSCQSSTGVSTPGLESRSLWVATSPRPTSGTW